jgi:hypothetical protein
VPPATSPHRCCRCPDSAATAPLSLPRCPCCCCPHAAIMAPPCSPAAACLWVGPAGLTSSLYFRIRSGLGECSFTQAQSSHRHTASEEEPERKCFCCGGVHLAGTARCALPRGQTGKVHRSYTVVKRFSTVSRATQCKTLCIWWPMLQVCEKNYMQSIVIQTNENPRKLVPSSWSLSSNGADATRGRAHGVHPPPHVD